MKLMTQPQQDKLVRLHGGIARMNAEITDPRWSGYTGEMKREAEELLDSLGIDWRQDIPPFPE